MFRYKNGSMRKGKRHSHDNYFPDERNPNGSGLFPLPSP